MKSHACFSSQGDTVINILIDVNGFLTYENRELLVLEDNEDVLQVEEGGREGVNPTENFQKSFNKKT